MNKRGWIKFFIFSILLILIVLLILYSTSSPKFYSPDDEAPEEKIISSNNNIYLSDQIILPEERRIGELPPKGKEEYFSEIDELREVQTQLLPPIPPTGEPQKQSLQVVENSETTITGKAVSQFKPSYHNSPCTSAFTATLTPQQLVIYLSQKDLNCLNSLLWSNNAGLAQTMNNNNMVAVLNDLNARSLTYNGVHNTEIYNLLYFVRSAYYMRSYYPATYNFSQQVLSSTNSSLYTLSQNTHLFDYTSTSNEILDSWIIDLDNSGFFYQYTSTAERILEDFRARPQAVNNYWHTHAVYSTFYAHSRALWPGAGAQFTTYQNSISQRTINSIWNITMNFAYNTSQHVWIIDNSLWYGLGPIMQHVPNYNAAARIAATDAIYNYTYLSEPYLWALYTVDYYNNCTYGYVNLSQLCISDVRPDIIALALPNNYSFEDNSIKFITKLPRGTSEKLYSAIKDVDQQFYRLTGSNYPVQGDNAKEIKMVVYGTRQDYILYQPFLYGLSTNNGGIYIEGWGMLFTYERTPQESLYTLEELLRHEYTHYLQGRYLIKGLWGQAPIYSNGRLVWFEEGSAEFLSGSSSEAGIRLRKSVVQTTQYYPSYPIPTISQVVHSTYNNNYLDYYMYGAILFQFLYEQRKDILFDILSKVRTEDITGYDNIMNAISQDQNLNNQFMNYVNLQISNIPNLVNPNTVWLNASNLATNNISQIQNTLSSSPYYLSQQCYVSSSLGLPRFTCKSAMTGYLSTNWTNSSAWSYFNGNLNSFYQFAQTQNINNYNELNCRLGRISFVQSTGGNYPLADYQCEGPLGLGNHLVPRTAQKVQQDLNEIQISNFNNCNLVSNTNVFCNATIDTVTHQTQANALIELNQKVDSLQRKMFSLNPQYYRELNVSRQGNPSVFTSGNGTWLRQQMSIIANLSI